MIISILVFVTDLSDFKNLTHSYQKQDYYILYWEVGEY